MSWFTKIAQESILSRREFEDMMARVYNINREYLVEEGIRTWQEWLEQNSPYNISLSLESDSHTYDRYLANLPEEIRAIDLINMYMKGELPEEPSRQYRFQNPIIEPTAIGESSLPWQSQSRKELNPEEAKQMFATATQRAKSSNREEVAEARKQLYLSFNTDKLLSEKLGIKQSELNKKIKSYSGLSVRSRQTEDRLNHDVPEEHQWVGISNSSFIGRQRVDPEELDQFVKSIEVTKEGERSYFGSNGAALRRYIANTFLSIDTRISYEDLSFKIGKFEKKTTNGNYNSQNNLITIADINPNTVAHEIGHYLDYKFARDFGFNSTPLSDTRSINTHNEALVKRVPQQQLQWAEKYYSFVQNLMGKSDISSEYTQSPSEVFARFIDFFTRWTDRTHNISQPWRNYRNDKFTEQDCNIFVKLLQEKSFLNAKYGVGEQL